MSYRELEQAEARELGRGCAGVVLLALALVAALLAADVAGCRRTGGVPSVEDVRSDDAPALVGLAYGTYAYPAWDRANNVCYLVVTRGDQMVVVPRLNPDGTVMVLTGERGT